MRAAFRSATLSGCAAVFALAALAGCSADEVGTSVLGGAKNWCRHSGGGVCHVNDTRAPKP